MKQSRVIFTPHVSPFTIDASRFTIHASRHQTYVPTAPAGSEVVTHLPLKAILKFCDEWPSFSTIKTFFPEGVLNATLFKFPVILDPILTEPAGTNFDACAMI